MAATIDWTIIFQWLNISLFLLMIAVPILAVILLILKICKELRKK